jgi:hypothetical protein
VPVARLSAEDQAFLLKAASLPKPKGVSVPGSLAKCNGFDAFWPSAAQCSLDLKIDVISEDKSTQKFIYQSAHFQFVCNAQLRPTVIAALATVFEGTHELLRVIPLNNRLTATPPSSACSCATAWLPTTRWVARPTPPVPAPAVAPEP